MGGLYEPHICRACQQGRPTVAQRRTGAILCDPCYQDALTLDAHDRAIAEHADAPAPPAPPRCRDCARDQDRYETRYEHWVLLEPRVLLPVPVVPEGWRWIVAGDGHAENRDTPPSPETRCRIPHQLVCPVWPRPRHPVLAAVWDLNRSHHPGAG
ncbi:DUF6083 domain-containing protein [Streptomyces sp. SAJ15]|uniref:DUF6083 domain-containing protein n=1 Tax=Streptomyces sp. SAJ15 TaxID=2011095 RepID=UPI001185398C|nr:DUF6083 domain-containing protein [Streptomyces sp. SAJ15]TVL91040.1 hypothetical protein CD790_17160 [Streptomyces sp. SAJ15]